MCLLAIDLGGTKLAVATFTDDGDLLHKEKTILDKRTGGEVGQLIIEQIEKFQVQQKVKGDFIQSVGISVPGIFHSKAGTVWAPNIPGWESYPLLDEVRSATNEIPIAIDSDRSCYILGEWWKGAAKDCTDAIFVAVGTGIGAGILIDGKILRGADDIAGAIGWMALERPFKDGYVECGCFESAASGEGIAKFAREIISIKKDYNGPLKNQTVHKLTAVDVFDAYEKEDGIAKEVIEHCIEYWGMAIANLVSLFNPQKIILGGGVFGPAKKFIPAIYQEAKKWAQPVSIKQVSIEESALGFSAGLYGAAYMAMQNLKTQSQT